jgi:hypothetical protein
MTGYSLSIEGEASSIEDLTAGLQQIQKKLQEGYTSGIEGELHWDLEEL